MLKYYFYKFLRTVFPIKGNDKFTIITKCISLVAVLGIIVCSVWLFVIEFNHAKLRQDNKQIQEVMKEIIENRDEETGTYDFEVLIEQNSDIRAWISIPGTDIDYPVCQTDNNDYYLDRDFDKKYSAFGTLFFDCENNVLTSQNLTIYGHSLKNSQMFTNIKRYSNINYYKKHPIIQLITPEGLAEYKVFAAMVMNAIPEHDNGYLFPFTQTDFERQRDFINWKNEAIQRSVIITSVDVIPSDRILTLSTCAYTFDNERFVVMARQVREGESNTVDVDGASRNPNPRYPKIWYDVNEKKYPW